MGTLTGVEVRIGWDDSEQKEFIKAIRQPLMVQTPLQLVIENLFNRLQAQANFMQDLKVKMDRIAVKDVTADELLHRIRLLESQQGDAAGPKLNPFNQQEIIARMELLEKKLADGVAERGSPQRERGVSASRREDDTDLDVRVSRLEKRLTGVYNLNGKLVAVEQIANGLGVAIPDLEYPTGGGPPATGSPRTGTAGMLSSPGLSSSAAQAGGGPTPAVSISSPPIQSWRPPGAPFPQTGSSQMAAPVEWVRPRPADAAADAEDGGAGVRSTRSPSPGPNSAVFGEFLLSSAAQNPTAPQMRGSSPSHSPRLVGTPNSPTRTSVMGSPSVAVSGVGGSGGPVSAQRLVQLGQEVGGLRSENEALKETVSGLVHQVAGLRSGLGSNAVESLSRLQQVEEGVGTLQAQLADMMNARRDAAGRTGSEVTFADMSLLRNQVESSVAEAKAQAMGAASLAERELPVLTARLDELAEALRKKGEPRDIDALFHERLNTLEATMGDMKTELLGSIEAAMESAVKVDDLQALEEVLEAKAPAEALRMLQQQTHALSQAVAGIGDAFHMRPELGDALRSGGAGNGMLGPLATKLRCLTCDQPIKNLPGMAGNLSAGGASGMVAKGSFLPRLDSMPGKEGLPAGPGIMVADLRASKEERLAGLQVASTGGNRGGGGGGAGIKAGDLEEYANGGAGGGAGQRDGGSPGRAVERSRAARVPVTGGLGKPGAAPAPGKPVFL